MSTLHAMKACGGVEGELHSFLTSALVELNSFLHRVQYTCTTGWYAAMTLITSVTTST